jgi:hypothetical protein
MPYSTPLSMPYSSLFRSLLPEGWFVSLVGREEDRITINCQMFSRDYDAETGFTDIVLCDMDSELPETPLYCAAEYHAVFQLQDDGPAYLLRQTFPLNREMPEDMAAAIAALIIPENFPEAVVETDYPEDEDSRIAFWASVNQQVSSMTLAGDHGGAIKLQTEAANKLINWTDPPPEEDEVPEPNLEDMVPPTYSLIEAADQEEDNYLPVGGHLLPEDFQRFLSTWNRIIAASTGDWIGEPRETYRLQNPELWHHFRVQLKTFTKRYPAELEALKAYQVSAGRP